MMDLGGYGWTLVRGWGVTLTLGLSALVVATLVGLLVAMMSPGRIGVLRGLARGYTVLARGIPELVLILLVYFGAATVIQRAVRSLGGSFAEFRLDVNPFVAATATLGLIYAA